MTVARQSRTFYSLNEAAEVVGVDEKTIRLAEADGRLPEPRRDEIGHRMYAEVDLERVRAALGR